MLIELILNIIVKKVMIKIFKKLNKKLINYYKINHKIHYILYKKFKFMQKENKIFKQDNYLIN